MDKEEKANKIRQYVRRCCVNWENYQYAINEMQEEDAFLYLRLMEDYQNKIISISLCDDE